MKEPFSTIIMGILIFLIGLTSGALIQYHKDWNDISKKAKELSLMQYNGDTGILEYKDYVIIDPLDPKGHKDSLKQVMLYLKEGKMD